MTSTIPLLWTFPPYSRDGPIEQFDYLNKLTLHSDTERYRN